MCIGRTFFLQFLRPYSHPIIYYFLVPLMHNLKKTISLRRCAKVLNILKPICLYAKDFIFYIVSFKL